MYSSRKTWLSSPSSVPPSTRRKLFSKRLALLNNQNRIEAQVLTSPTRTEINVENENEAEVSSVSVQNVESVVAESQINEEFVISSSISRNESNNDSIDRSLTDEDRRKAFCADLLGAYSKYNMSKVSFNNILSIINNYTNLVPKTLNSLLTEINMKNVPKFSEYIYCNKCSKTFEFVSSKCIDCLGPVSSFFHINILDQIKEIVKTNIFDSKFVNSKLYDNILKNENGKFLTFTINTDGAKLFEKSIRSFHLVYIVFNELAPNLRFQLKNVILAGIWVGQKPDYNHYLKPIVDELLSLERGEVLNFNSELSIVKFYTIFGVFDKPARYAILNMTQYNGDYGCSKCYQRGSSLKTKRGGTRRV